MREERSSVDEVEKITAAHIEKVARRMRELMQGCKGLFFIVSAPFYYDDLIKQLQNLNVAIEGPIRTDINPVGLFWEASSPERLKGYLLGSVHLTHRSFIALNSQIWKHFGLKAPDPHLRIISLNTLKAWASPRTTGQAIYDMMKAQLENVLMMEKEIWGHGFLELLELVTKAIPSTPEIRQKRAARNLQMSKNIDELIKMGKKPFIVVGSMHMIGSSSILANLSGMGYTVKRIVHEQPKNLRKI